MKKLPADPARKLKALRLGHPILTLDTLSECRSEAYVVLIRLLQGLGVADPLGRAPWQTAQLFQCKHALETSTWAANLPVGGGHFSTVVLTQLLQDATEGVWTLDWMGRALCRDKHVLLQLFETADDKDRPDRKGTWVLATRQDDPDVDTDVPPLHATYTVSGPQFAPTDVSPLEKMWLVNRCIRWRVRKVADVVAPEGHLQGGQSCLHRHALGGGVSGDGRDAAGEGGPRHQGEAPG